MVNCADFLGEFSMIDYNNVFSYDISYKITKFSLTQNAMPRSNNFQLFLGSSLLTFFMKTKSYYNYGFDAYFL